jgi:hypothetical protein
VKPFSELMLKHKGQRICVMGGAPSLASDIENVKADVWISCNEHGAKLRDVDYIVAMDRQHTVHHVPMLGWLRKHSQAPIIGPWGFADYLIGTYPLEPKQMVSGVVASWVAYMMGAHPVILAGFDCYQSGGVPAYHQHELYVPHIKGEVRVCSGPLTKLYPQYRANERRKAYEVPEGMNLLTATDGDVRVRVAHPVEIRGVKWDRGAEFTINRREVRLQIKHKSLIEV